MLKRNFTEKVLASAVLDLPMLFKHLPQWQRLCERSIEDCVYYDPRYAIPLLETVERQTPVRFVTAWDGNRLAGLLPVVRKRQFVPGMTVAGRAWQSDYTYSCMPLLDSQDPEASASTLLDGLARLSPAEWLIPNINTEGPAASAMIWALEAREAPWALQGDFERASLRAGPPFERHMQDNVSSKRRRELARNRRRLEEKGKVSVRCETDGAGLDNALQIFLELEASGWKGKRGTALACQQETRVFAERAFGSKDAGGSCRIDLLQVDGEPVAAGIVVFSGRTGFTIKGGYNEAYAGYSVGLLLEQEVIKSFLTERWADRLDAATNGKHVIDSLWPDRTKVADLAFSFSPIAAAARLKSLIGVNKVAATAKQKLKNLLGY